MEALAPGAALIALPFVAYAVVWVLARVFSGDTNGESDTRVEPPSSPNHQSRVIPGGRRDESE